MECREIHFTSSSLPSRAVGVIAPNVGLSKVPRVLKVPQTQFT